jgi:hypothetical protein
MEHPNPTPAGCVLMVATSRAFHTYHTFVCLSDNLPHVLDQDLKQMLQEFVLAVLMFDFTFLFFSSFFFLQIC